MIYNNNREWDQSFEEILVQLFHTTDFDAIIAHNECWCNNCTQLTLLQKLHAINFGAIIARN